MVTIFFFNGRADDFNERLTACQQVFQPQQYDQNDTLENFADRYTEFISNYNSQKICFLHISPLEWNIVNRNLCIEAGQNDVYAVWFSGGEIGNRPAYRHYFPNSIFAETTNDGYDPSREDFWWEVRDNMRDKGWIA